MFWGQRENWYVEYEGCGNGVAITYSRVRPPPGNLHRLMAYAIAVQDNCFVQSVSMAVIFGS